MNEEIDDINSFDFSDSNPLAELITIHDVYNHPNADALDLVSPDGSNVNFAIVKKGTFKKGDLAIWIDSVNDPMVPVDNPLFSFLSKSAKADGYARIKAMRLRGTISRGLIIPFSYSYEELDTTNINKSITEFLKIKKYLPLQRNWTGTKFNGGKASGGPVKLLPTAKYDVESILKNWKYIPNGTSIVLTEKIHGANSCFGWLDHTDGVKFRVRSRTLFKKEPEPGESGGLWWDTAIKYNLEEKLAPYPGYVLYGEIYGKVQDLRYGLDDDYAFAAFDCWISHESRYMTWEELEDFCKIIDVPTVPVISRIIWNTSSGVPDEIRNFAEGKTLIASAENIREGVVLRADISLDIVSSDYSSINKINKRIIYKLVGNGYLMR